MASDGLGRADADAPADAARNTFWKGKISHQSSVNNCITLQLCPKEMGKRGSFGTERLRWQLCVSRETAADLHDPVGSRDARRWTSKARACAILRSLFHGKCNVEEGCEILVRTVT